MGKEARAQAAAIPGAGKPLPKRSDEEIVCQQATIRLDGEDHTIRVKSIAESLEYRRALGRLLKDAKAYLRGMDLSDLLSGAASKTKGGNKDKDVANKALGLEMLVELAAYLLSDGIAHIPDIVKSYCPELKDEIARASDEELLDAAQEVIRLTFPLLLKMANLAMSTFQMVKG